MRRWYEGKDSLGSAQHIQYKEYMTTSFGKYFDDQRDRVIKAMQNKNAKQYIEWREDYEKRMLINHQVGRAMFPTCAEEKKLLEDMIDKGRL